MILVRVDDLAFAEVDAIIRPADATLDPVTTTAARLDRQAGARFAEQRKIQQALVPGAAVVTGAGELPAKFMVHAVIQSAEQSATSDTVRRALVSAWQRAAQWQLATIAMPLIGAGAGQLPVEEAARLLRDTLDESRRASGFPASVVVMVERDTDRAEIELIVGRPGPA
ncbi:MAG TPA: macro domain-containing protein [Gemmatimonadales bacterium]|nr:macro domain-containing protein [Gemmatimonadales bacterium]